MPPRRRAPTQPKAFGHHGAVAPRAAIDAAAVDWQQGARGVGNLGARGRPEHARVPHALAAALLPPGPDPLHLLAHLARGNTQHIRSLVSGVSQRLEPPLDTGGLKAGLRLERPVSRDQPRASRALKRTITDSCVSLTEQHLPGDHFHSAASAVYSVRPDRAQAVETPSARQRGQQSRLDASNYALQGELEAPGGQHRAATRY